MKTQISYHHLVKRAEGGKKTIHNGALLMPVAHELLHIIECKEIKIYEMINNLSGSKKPNYKTDTSSKYNKLKSLLTNLMGWGAHVAHIKPEYLMTKEEYMKFYQKKIIRQMLGFNYYGAPDLSTIDQKALSSLEPLNRI